MKQLLKIFILSLFLHSSSLFSQTNFEKGMFVTNSNEKVECLIKNVDWKNSPTEFKYRLTVNGDIKTQNIGVVKEFEIYNNSKYVKATLDIDRSSSSLDNLTEDRNPVFNQETLFLKVIVEGEATLYHYEDGNLKRFFYKFNKNVIEQLVFKEYLRNVDGIGENNYYKQQLFNNLKCETITISDVEKLNYRAKNLSVFFETYNNCNGDLDTVNYQTENKRNLFSGRVKFGLGQSSLSVRSAFNPNRNIDFDSETIFRVGAELEMIMPFNNNKWALIVEPSYQSYTSKRNIFNPEAVGVFREVSIEAKYSTIEIPLGVRHYFFISDDSKIFINGYYSFIVGMNSEIKYSTSSTLEIKTKGSPSFGLGYNYKKYSLEFRYEVTRNVLHNFVGITSDYNQIALIFGYQFF